MEWTETSKYIKGISSTLDIINSPTRIASFDLDDTIVELPRFKDARLKFNLIPNVKKILSSYIADNYAVIIFTNQSGMSQNKNFDIEHWKKDFDRIFKHIVSGIDSYYFAIYVAKSHDIYRKPNPGMWSLMKRDIDNMYNKGNKVGISTKSFYCGDAAGRTSPSGLVKMLHKNAKADHSDTDRKFAINVGVDFFTPDEIFMKDKTQIRYKLSGINPSDILKKYVCESPEIQPRKKELIIIVGPPASGKSTVVSRISGYEVINQDTCGSRAKCLQLMKTYSENEKNIIVDNTNPDIQSRKDFITLAQKAGYKHIRCVIMTTPIEIAKHMNNVRHLYTGTKKIPSIVYSMYAKKYIEPRKAEGFDVIESYPFCINKKILKDKKWIWAFNMLSEQ